MLAYIEYSNYPLNKYAIVYRGRLVYFTSSLAYARAALAQHHTRVSGLAKT